VQSTVIMNDYLARIFTKERHIRALTLHCSCSRETLERVLTSLGREELSRTIADQEMTEVSCECCGRRYPFSCDELTRLREERG
jgi:molecular chaperone Hsp33